MRGGNALSALVLVTVTLLWLVLAVVTLTTGLVDGLSILAVLSGWGVIWLWWRGLKGTRA